MVRLQVLTVADITMTAFWYTVPSGLVEVTRRFGDSHASIFRAMIKPFAENQVNI
jgi:hypothetical protein